MHGFVKIPNFRDHAKFFGRIRGFALNRRGGVLMITAVSAPLLIAATGLTVDMAYAYQQQVGLQRAAAAAAMAAARAANQYSITAASTSPTPAAFATGTAETFAIAAANNATTNKYAFAATGSDTVTVSETTATVNGTSLLAWVATVQTPRGDYFSGVKGLGLAGLPVGTQAATAKADYVSAASPAACLIAKSAAIQAYNYPDSTIEASNCSVYGGASSCPFSADDGLIEGTAVYDTTAAEEPNGGTGCLGSNAGDYGGTLPAQSHKQYGITQESFPGDLVSLATPPTEAAYITSATTGVSQPTGLSSGTIVGGNGTPMGLQINHVYGSGANYGATPTSLSIGTSNNTSPFTMASSGTTVVTGGIDAIAGAFTLAGSEVYLSASSASGQQAFDPKLSGSNQSITFATTGAIYEVNGETTFDSCGSGCTNETINFADATYYFDGGSATNYAMYFNYAFNATFAANSAVYVYGTVTNDNNSTITFNTGTYVFDGAVSDQEGSLVFGGGTVIFYDGLDIVNSTTSVTFGPGIYYVLGGNLYLGAKTVVANGATFIFENQATWELSDQDGGGSFTMTAPSTGCEATPVLPTATYPASEGICGVLFYKVPTDTAEDGIENDNSTPIYLNGIIQEPGAELQFSTTENGAGNGVVEASTGGYLEVEVAGISDSDSRLYLTAPTGSGSGGQSTIT